VLAIIPLDDPVAPQPHTTGSADSSDQASNQETPSGDREAGPLDFDTFFLRFQRPLYTYLRRLLPTEETAIDLTQEAFFRAWSHFEELHGYERPEAWLFRVATNLAISELRRHRPLQLSRLLRRDPHDQVSEDARMLPDAIPDVAEGVAEREIIARSLQGLSERHRAALLLRAAYGFSVEEVAKALGLSVANTYQSLSRGARRFRNMYDAAQRESDG
jgi:RNA polymerase sigma-70 factor (ECF subfamily)